MSSASHVTAPSTPFKGLTPFAATDLDALLFFGREREAELISANLMASRLTVLYGESGVGKTSLLAAGVVHRLRGIARRNLAERGHPEFVVVMFSAWSDDPVAGLLAEVRGAVAEVFGPAAVTEPERGTSLAERLQAWTGELGCDVLLILDQAEEYFLYHEGEEGTATFAEQLPDLVTGGGLRASVLLAIREDALAKLDRFKGRIPNLFGNYLRLEHLGRSAARSAILGPVRRYNELHEGAPIEVEDELVEQVLDETAAGRVDLGQAGRGVVRGTAGEARIEAAFLQLVLERLWDEEMREGSRTLRLATLGRLGGSAEIVRNHLERALEVLTPAEKDIAANLFNHLVTPSGTKIAHAPRDLADYASVGRGQLAPVLSTLVRERILRPAATRDGADGRDESPVEIFHDVLTDAVLAWRSRHEADRALDRERRAAERRHRRTVLIAGGAMVALALVAAVAIFALVQRGEAREQAREARAQRADAQIAARSARARELAARATSQLGSDPHDGLLLAVRAARLERTATVEQVLRAALIADRLRALLPSGAGPVTAAAFSPDGQVVAVAGRLGGIRIYRRSGRLVRTLQHPGRLVAAALSADGRVLATGGPRGARVWRIPGGATVALRGEGRVFDVSVARDGGRLVTASADGGVRLWRASGGTPLWRAAVPPPARAVELSPDGRTVAVVDGDGTARLLDASTGALRLVLDQRLVTGTAFSPGGRLLATASADRTARIWDVPRAEPHGNPLRGHQGRVLDLAFSPRGTLLVTVSADGTGRVWDLDTAELVSQLVGHTNFVVDASFSPDGAYVVTASTDRTARVWKADTGAALATLVGHRDSVRGATFAPGGATVLTRSDDGTARVWISGTRPELRVFARGARPVRDATFSPDGARILSADDAGRVEIRDVRTKRVISTFRERAGVASAAYSPDGTLVAAASGREVSVRRARDGRIVMRLRHPAVVADLAFSPGGRRIATASRDGIARVWSLDGLPPLRAFARLSRPLTSIAYSRDGRLVVGGSEDRTARVWDARTGVLRRTLRGHTDAVTGVDFSGNGKLVVTSSRDHDARIWDVSSGRTLRVLRVHFAGVNDAAFSPDSRWVVTAGPQSGGLWNARTGRLLFLLRGPARRLFSASFEPRGRRVVTGGEDGALRLYDCAVCGRLEALVALAEARLAGARRAP